MPARQAWAELSCLWASPTAFGWDKEVHASFMPKGKTKNKNDMKQIALAIVICSVAIVSHAQEHLNFMDIPLDCPLDVFCNKLISNRGLVAAKMSE